MFFFFFVPENLFSKVFTHVDGGATYVDSDTGLESMSSAEATTKACSLCLDGVVASNNMMVPPEANMQIEGLKQEVTRLKCDKLDLLRQNVVSSLCRHRRRNNDFFLEFFVVLDLCESRKNEKIKHIESLLIHFFRYFISIYNSRHAKGILSDYVNVNCRFKVI